MRDVPQYVCWDSTEIECTTFLSQTPRFKTNTTNMAHRNLCYRRWSGVALALLIFFTRLMDGQPINDDVDECVCSNATLYDDPLEISVAFIYDLVGYWWGEDVVRFATDMINDGWLNILENGERLRVLSANSSCDAAAAAKAYWDIRKKNGNQPMQAIVGARCSSATISVARFATQEQVPQISFSATSSELSDTFTFPYFSRNIAPDDSAGEVGAIAATLREFGWTNVNILATDTDFSRGLTNEFKRIWEGQHDDETGSWVGTVLHSGIIPIANDGEADDSSIELELGRIPPDSKVVLLFAHDQHAYRILQLSEETDLLQEDTYWFGVSSWIDSPNKLNEAKVWLGEISQPGYIGLVPYTNKNADFYKSTLNLLNTWQSQQGKNMWDDLPSFWAGYLFDAIVVIVKALAQLPPESRRDGALVTKTLRENVAFEGMTGTVEFDPTTGDRSDILYAVLNLQKNQQGNDFEWVEIGSTSTTFGSTEINERAICFAGEDACGTGIPDDLRPTLEEENGNARLPAYGIALIVVPFVLLLIVLAKYRRSKKSKEAIKKFRDSMVGLGTAQKYYVPDVAAGKDTTSKNFIRSTDTEQVQDTNEASQRPEQRSKASSKQRALESALRNVDYLSVVPIPTDIVNEPQMLLVKGDIVQVTKRRADGWVFGSKISYADEGETTQLVNFANDGTDEPSVTADSGWFPTRCIRDPSREELRTLKKNVGSTGKLEAPGHWLTGEDASKVQRIRLDEAGHTSDEYAKVYQKFMDTIGNRDTKVISIERVQNLAMWQGYVVKRQTICFPGGSSTTTGTADMQEKEEELSLLQKFERCWLWHGTDETTMRKIIQQGFNRSFCGKNATRYGKGVYFAENAKKSANTRYSKPDRDGRQYMFACRVVLGEYCVGRRNALTPDLRDIATQSLYDSTVDNVDKPSTFVTYHDAQAYPEYIITFQSSSTSNRKKKEKNKSSQYPPQDSSSDSDSDDQTNSDDDDDDDDDRDNGDNTSTSASSTSTEDGEDGEEE